MLEASSLDLRRYVIISGISRDQDRKDELIEISANYKINREGNKITRGIK